MLKPKLIMYPRYWIFDAILNKVKWSVALITKTEDCVIFISIWIHLISNRSLNVPSFI